MKFEMITVDEFNKEHGINWESPQIYYEGEIQGYCIGVTPEIRLKNGRLDSESTTFVYRVDDLNDDFWNHHREDVAHAYDWTGRLVFRGYYSVHYDYVEREEYYVEENFGRGDRV